jgi:hypothetical protein
MFGQVSGLARTGALVLVAGALVLGLSACGGTTEAASTGGAFLVPAGVPAFLAIDADPASPQWKTLKQLAAKFPDERDAVQAAKQQLRKHALDWDKDVKPALGSELDLVLLDLDKGGQDAVGLLQPDDDDAFERVMAQANATGDSKLVYDDFHGWKVLAETQAQIDRFESMSDSAQDTLDQDASFRSAMSSTPADALVKAYVDGRKVMSKIDASVGADQQKFVQDLGSLDWAALSLAAKPDGIGFDTTVHGTPGSLFGPGKTGRPFAARLPATAPGDAVLYYTFHGAGGIFSRLDDTAAFGTKLGPFADVLGKLGSLLEGENAIYVRPPASGRLPEVTLVTRPKRGVSGRSTLDHILAGYRKQLGVLPRHGTVAGTPASTLGLGKVTLSWADVDGRFVISDLPAGIAAVKSPGTPLAESATFREAVQTAGMPAQTHGFLYVDVRAGTGLVEKLSGTKLPAAISRNLKPLRSALEYAVSRQHQLSVRVFLQIR